MSECDQIHPLLASYLQDKLSTKDRRLVARHLNICASARKDLGFLMRAPKKQIPPVSKPVSEPLDFKILNWLFKTPKAYASKTIGMAKRSVKWIKADSKDENLSSTASPIKAIGGLFLFFLALVFLTHFIQNPISRKTLHAWLRLLTLHTEKESPISDMILDFRSLPRWQGASAPVVKEQSDVISDSDHLDVYWSILKPPADEPRIDFNQNALVLFLGGMKPTIGYSISLKRMETKPESTIIWYEEAGPPSALPVNGALNSPWVLQVIPKPPKPVVFKKIDS